MAKKSDDNRPDRDEKGLFLPGNRVEGRGRPKGSIDFMATLRRRADDADISLEDLVWGVAKAMFQEAMAGDVQAARVILDRTCGPIDKTGSAVQVNVNGPSTSGPPIPKARELGEFVDRMHTIAIENGLLQSQGDGVTVDVHEEPLD